MKPKGDGTVSFDKAKGRWIAKVPVGKYKDGRTRYKSGTAGSRSEAEKLRRHLHSELAAGRLPAGPELTFEQYTRAYFDGEAKSRQRDTTRNTAFNLLRSHAFPVIGGTPIARIRAFDLTCLFNDMRATHSVSTINHVRKLVSSVFASAERNELVLSNPTRLTAKLRAEEGAPSRVKVPVDRGVPLRTRHLPTPESACSCFWRSTPGCAAARSLASSGAIWTGRTGLSGSREHSCEVPRPCSMGAASRIWSAIRRKPSPADASWISINL